MYYCGEHANTTKNEHITIVEYDSLADLSLPKVPRQKFPSAWEAPSANHFYDRKGRPVNGNIRVDKHIK